MDPVSLYLQNAPIEDVIGASRSEKTEEWKLENVLRGLFASNTVSSAYKAKAAKISTEMDLNEDVKELAFEVLAESLLAPVDQYSWVDYGGTSVRVLNPFTNQTAPLIGDTIGLLLWEAEICILEWLEANASKVHGLRVLEIGAGVGLAGLAAVDRLGASHVTLTDTNAKVLENLQVIAEHSRYPDRVEVACLEWYDLKSIHHFTSYDFILAADCLYDPNDVPTFVEVLRILLQQERRPTALLACSIRNRNTFDKLMVELKLIGLPIRPTSVLPENQRYSRRTTHMFTKDWSSSRVEMFLVQACDLS